MLPSRPGRGATRNDVPQRFNLAAREVDGDWLDAAGDIDGEPPPLRTTVTIEHPKTIITRNASPDIAFDRSINPYRGCEHGCIYCFARPTHAFHDLSPGLDFESKLFAKPNAAELLRKELAKRGYVARPIAFGTNTDPYQPIEAKWRITRACLEVLAECRHPFTITTKSDRGGFRDLDLIAPVAALGLAAVFISVPTIDPVTARTLEPRAPRPAKRLAAVRALAAAGVPVHVSIAPVVPQITDHELEHIVAAAAEAGARAVFFLPVRLPHEVAPAVSRLARRVPSRSRHQGDGDDPVDPWRGATTIPISTRGCRARARGPTCCARASASPAPAPDSTASGWRCAPTCSERPRATSYGCFSVAAPR